MYFIMASITCILISIGLKVQHVHEINQWNRWIEASFTANSHRYMTDAKAVLEEYKEYFEILSLGDFSQRKGASEGLLLDDQWHELEWLSDDDIKAIDSLSHAFQSIYGPKRYNRILTDEHSILVQFGRSYTWARYILGRCKNVPAIFIAGIERNETLEKEPPIEVEPGSVATANRYIYREHIQGPYFLHLTREMGQIESDGHLTLRIFLLIAAGVLGIVALIKKLD